MISKDEIINAWVFLRKKNHSISDETLDFMKNISIEALEKIENANKGILSFEDIVEEPGQYVSEDFSRGVVLLVDHNKGISLLTYEDENDMLPMNIKFPFYAGLLKKKYRRILNRKELFK
jgi:hypothetical protein